MVFTFKYILGTASVTAAESSCQEPSSQRRQNTEDEAVPEWDPWVFLGTKPLRRKGLHINQTERSTWDDLIPANIWQGDTLVQ